MKSYQLRQAEGFDALQLTEVPTPQPGPGEILVRMRAASLNYRDLMMVKGAYGNSGFKSVRPLSDGAGEVVEVGPGVTMRRVGDKVAGLFFERWVAGSIQPFHTASALGGEVDGTLAEYRVFREDGVVPIPAGYSFEEAATLPCASVTAWHALFEQVPFHPGDTVLVQGTGGVSIFALQMVKAAGGTVVITSRSAEKLERAKAMGADLLINTTETPDWEKEAYRLTDHRGVDHVVDVIGGESFNRSLRAIRMGGTVSLIGVLAGRGGDIQTALILGKSAKVQGIYVGSGEMFQRMNTALSANGIRPVIDRVFPFEEARAAYEHLESGTHFGKIVISI